jgi:hypothetical protein
MKILLVTNKFFVEDGGSYTAVSELSYSLNRQEGIKAKIFHNNNNNILNISNYSSVIKKFDIIHIFGIWSPFSNIIIYLARKMKKKNCCLSHRIFRNMVIKSIKNKKNFGLEPLSEKNFRNM